MKRARFTEEQIIGILAEHEAGAKCADLCRKYGMSEGTFYNWKAKFGGMTVPEAKRLKAFKDENCQAEEATRRADARPDSDEGAALKKVVTLAAKREAVSDLKRSLGLSERHACQLAGADRRMIRYVSRRASDVKWSPKFGPGAKL